MRKKYKLSEKVCMQRRCETFSAINVTLASEKFTLVIEEKKKRMRRKAFLAISKRPYPFVYTPWRSIIPSYLYLFISSFFSSFQICFLKC